MITKASSLIMVKAKPISDAFSSDFSSTSPFSKPALGMTGLSSIQAIQQGFENKEMMALRERVAALHNPPSPASLRPFVVAEKSETKTLEERLFDATANVKILTSQVAMHLDREWRERLFQQLDSLHDPEEWDAEDKPIQQSSFATFLKAIFQIRPTVRPGLGLSHGGLLVAAWTSGKNRLTIEFLPNDRVRWVISRYPEGEFEQFAGQIPVSSLLDSLSKYSPAEWLN
jgi:hypothetical protein